VTFQAHSIDTNHEDRVELWAITERRDLRSVKVAVGVGRSS
jgi:hypothetical protein